MPLTEEHLKIMFNCSQMLNGLSFQTSDIASALERLGLPISKELDSISQKQMHIAETISKLSGQILKSDIDSINANSRNVLEAVLSGIELKRIADQKGAII